jgi:hypothetical protein
MANGCSIGMRKRGKTAIFFCPDSSDLKDKSGWNRKFQASGRGYESLSQVFDLEILQLRASLIVYNLRHDRISSRNI